MTKKPASPKTPPKKAAVKTTVERRANLRRRDDDVLPDFRDMIENAIQGILVHRNFKPLYANQAFAAMFGYENAQDILDLPLIRPLVPDDLWPRVEEEYGELMQGRKPIVINRTRGIHKDGHEIWTSVTERVMDWHGMPAVQWNAFDISKQMEIEHNLLQNEQHLRAILEILPYPIYIARRHDGQLLFVNRKTCLLFQSSASHLLHSLSTSLFVDPSERENLSQMLDTIPDIRDVEVTMRTALGRVFTAEFAAIRMDYGNHPAVLVALNDISQRKQLEADLFHQANTDALTNISNRRYFMAMAEQELRRTRRFNRPLSMMMIDIDHFKPINDHYGHAVGDAVLQGIVKRALESLRQSDHLGRLGGEEFAVILAETNIAAAKDAAERLRKHIAAQPIPATLATGRDENGVEKPGQEIAIPCTVSVGIAQLTPEDKSVDALLNRADKALYRAKNSGRNRVEMEE